MTNQPDLANRLRLAHQARRAKAAQLDDVRRALCDAGVMQDDDPYSHADLANVIRQAWPTEAADAPSDDATAQCPKPGPHAPHMWTWREEGVDCPGIPEPAVAAPATADDGLRGRYAAAIRAKVDGTEGCANGHRLADAVMAVRDRRMEQLAAETAAANERARATEADNAHLRQRLDNVIKHRDQVEAERDRSDESARRCLAQRQEMAAERYAWQERGDRAEAAIERVRALHQPMSRAGMMICTQCSGWSGSRCMGVVTPYPCDTIDALAGPQHTCPDGEPCPPHDEPTPGAEAATTRVRRYIAGQMAAWPDDYPVVVPARDVLAMLDAPWASTEPEASPAATDAEATIARVRALHVPVRFAGSAHCPECSQVDAATNSPRRSFVLYPCPTIEALDGEAGQ